MGRKKDKKKKEDFSANPFKALKGFAVEGEKKSPPERQKEKAPQCSREDRTAPVEDDTDLFARQMKELGVEALDTEDDRLVGSVPEEAPPSRPEKKKSKRPGTDEELFRQALGEMDVCFRDKLPVEDESPPAPQPRRMKQVRRGTIRPQARLDLHGETRQQAVEKVAFFLQDCAHQGLQVALLITGRGYGSQEGPVLRPEIEKYLDSAGRSWVGEWGRAPKRYGGEGALIVFLKSR